MGDVLWIVGLEMGGIKCHVCFDFPNLSVLILVNQFYFGLNIFFF
jgi:hypothetical protein